MLSRKNKNEFETLYIRQRQVPKRKCCRARPKTHCLSRIYTTRNREKGNRVWERPLSRNDDDDDTKRESQPKSNYSIIEEEKNEKKTACVKKKRIWRKEKQVYVSCRNVTNHLNLMLKMLTLDPNRKFYLNVSPILLLYVYHRWICGETEYVDELFVIKFFVERVQQHRSSMRRWKEINEKSLWDFLLFEILMY